MAEGSGNPNINKTQFGPWSASSACSAERHVWRRHTNLSTSQQRQCQVCGQNAARKALPQEN